MFLKKTELKKCIENVGLELLRIVPKPIAKAISIEPTETKLSKNSKNILIDFNSGKLKVFVFIKYL